MIVRDLADAPRRFNALGHSVGVNARTLSDRLRRLEAEGFITRTAYAEIPPRVEYALTEKGRALLPILEAMRRFGERWGHPGGVPDGAPAGEG